VDASGEADLASSPEASDGYRAAKRAEAKTQVWQEFSEAVEKDFELDPERFWQTQGCPWTGWRNAELNGGFRRAVDGLVLEGG